MLIGRVGRKRNGFYYTSFTETRMSEMERTGRSYIKLMSMYQSVKIFNKQIYFNKYISISKKKIHLEQYGSITQLPESIPTSGSSSPCSTTFGVWNSSKLNLFVFYLKA